jgi:cellobiose phosphorylase
MTDDTGVLDEQVPFLHGRLPRADEESVYDFVRVVASAYLGEPQLSAAVTA